MRKYETPELEVTKFEVEQPIMDGEQGSDDMYTITHEYESVSDPGNAPWPPHQ